MHCNARVLLVCACGHVGGLLSVSSCLLSFRKTTRKIIPGCWKPKKESARRKKKKKKKKNNNNNNKIVGMK